MVWLRVCFHPFFHNTTSTGSFLDRLRRTCWPLLLQIDSNNYPPLGNRQQLRQSRHAGQVKLDVDRSIKRFPEKMPEAQRLILQEVFLESISLSVVNVYFLATDGSDFVGSRARR